jgi:RNA polymerase sigma factor (sigma-70 family)
MNDTDSISTRLSLLARLKDCNDQESWREFFDTYWRLIQTSARKAGLSDVEAEEVVQEVVIAAAKKMPEFTYVPGKDSLKGWLLGVTRWKIGDQFRKRNPKFSKSDSRTVSLHLSRERETSSRTATIERVPDPGNLEATWDVEWHENLLQVALNHVKNRVNPAHYEIYHLNVVQGLRARETARALGVRISAVHLAKFRVGKLVRKEVQRLKQCT